MNCSEFTGRWDAHVAGLLTPLDETDMLEHSRACNTCGVQWRRQEELSQLVASVVEPHKPPTNLAARIVDKLPPPTRPQGPLLENSGPVLGALTVQASPFLLAAMLGGAMMHIVSNLAGGAGGRGSMELVYAETISSRRGYMPGAASALGTIVGDCVGLLISIVFLIWITRASFWKVLFPLRFPIGLVIARWAAIPTVLFGAMRLLCGVWLLIGLSVDAMGAVYIDSRLVAAASLFLAQLWTLGFWLALCALLFGVLNEVLKRSARPLQ